MKKLKKHTSIIINPYCFTIFFFFNHSSCIDSNYESCVPKDCGDGHNISYPFFIHGLQDRLCGYPGFGLRCNINGSATLQILENQFIVNKIDYGKRKFELRYAAVSQNQTDFCISRVRNLTLDPTRFVIDDVPREKLLLMSNCPGDLSSEFDRYKVRPCDRNSSDYVVLKRDNNLSNVTRGCGEIVEMAVKLGGEEGRSEVVDGGNYMVVVERGFTMRWHATDCGGCERSGGRCGFNMTDFRFVCFCTDRPHKVSCKPGKNLYVMLLN